MLIIDDPISKYQSTFNYHVYADINGVLGYFDKTGSITLKRNGTEKPQLSVNATFTKCIQVSNAPKTNYNLSGNYSNYTSTTNQPVNIVLTSDTTINAK